MAQPQPSPMRPSQKGGKDSPLFKGLTDIKKSVDQILQKMTKDKNYVPERAELETFSRKAVDLIQKYHPKISVEHKDLLTAVIDLTEIPVMHPKMQRVAYQTALQDATANLDEYLSRAF